MEKKSIFILILSLLCSVSVMFVSVFCFLNLEVANQYTGFVAMLFSFYAPYLILRFNQ